jgi:hypothetical protein
MDFYFIHRSKSKFKRVNNELVDFRVLEHTGIRAAYKILDSLPWLTMQGSSVQVNR